jgi:hypothetical protein
LSGITLEIILSIKLSLLYLQYNQRGGLSFSLLVGTIDLGSDMFLSYIFEEGRKFVEILFFVDCVDSSEKFMPNICLTKWEECGQDS